MTRITARQIAVQLLFAMEANSASAEDTLALFFSEAPDEEQTAYIRRIVQTVEDRREEIDGVISRYSSGWKISRLTKSTLAILRCALCEILYLDDIPDAAAVNEAVELGKAYDSPQAGAFINGVLGSFLRGREQEQTEA